MKIAFQMENIADASRQWSSSLALIKEALHRGFEVYQYTPQQLLLHQNDPVAFCVKLALDNDEVAESDNKRSRLILAEMDVVMLRQDPPFNMRYITSTYILEKLHSGTMVINDPAQVRNLPEKLFPFEFAELTPPTVISSDKQEIIDFRAKHRDIVLKPLYAYGGKYVFNLMEHDKNLNSIYDSLMTIFNEPIVAQKYLPEVRDGDKRVLLIDGEVCGCFNRLPAQGSVVVTAVAGGKLEKAEMRKRDLEIASSVGAALREKGIIFAGIDIIGDYLTEINITSPSGIRQYQHLTGINLAEKFWDAVSSRLTVR